VKSVFAGWGADVIYHLRIWKLTSPVAVSSPALDDNMPAINPFADVKFRPLSDAPMDYRKEIDEIVWGMAEAHRIKPQPADRRRQLLKRQAALILKGER